MTASDIAFEFALAFQREQRFVHIGENVGIPGLGLGWGYWMSGALKSCYSAYIPCTSIKERLVLSSFYRRARPALVLCPLLLDPWLLLMKLRGNL